VTPALDMYDLVNGPPYSPQFLARFEQAQRSRLERIEHWVAARLQLLRSLCRAVNYAASQMGRITSLTGFLSQWSSASRADGPANLARTRVPALLCRGGSHYLAGQPELVMQVADEMAAWIHAL
jgi:hypothetical protein